ncbi:ABC-three component system middle component 2 [Escherichia coli]
MQVFEGNFEQRPFNTPLEYGFRALFILDAADNVAMDLQRIVSYDYLLVHTSDVPRGPKSLHPAVPHRGAELLVKWFTEFGHLNRGDMLTSEQHRCHNEKKKFQRRV